MENNISINSAKYQKKRKLMKFKDGLENFLISSLPVFGFLIFGAFPMVLSLVMSFFEMHDTDFSNAVFIGLDNYKNMLNFNVYGKDFLYTFLTAGIFMISVPIGLAIPIFIAYQLNKIQFAKHFFRSVFFVPAVCAVTIIVIVFKMFIDENSGVFNQILTGLHFEPVKWLTGNPLNACNQR
jgi:multiple sugar transport system permease protein